MAETIGVSENFNPLPSCEGRLTTDADALPLDAFQSTPLVRGETAQEQAEIKRPYHFNPLPSCEGRPRRSYMQAKLFYFNPLPSCEGRHTACRAKRTANHISIHSPRARGDGRRLSADHQGTLISIHSPRARGDMYQLGLMILADISIHSPRARGDPAVSSALMMAVYFNPLPSCEGRQHKPPKILLDSRQSIQQNYHSSFF